MNSRVVSGCFALACTAMPASAHAFLDHAMPGAGDTVASPPKQIMLTFSEPLEPMFSGASVTDGAGHDVAAGRATITGSSLTLPLKPLAAGSYRVTWHAVSIDTHRTQGSYRFTVRP